MKNNFAIIDKLAYISINGRGNELITVIDIDELEKVSLYDVTWTAHYNQCTKTWYVQSKYQGRILHLHRIISDTPEGLFTDHISGDTLDNRKSNLRNASRHENRQNLFNKKKPKDKIRGVNWHKRLQKWQASIGINYRQIHLGYFDNIKDAEEIVKMARAHYMPFSQDAMILDKKDIDVKKVEFTDRFGPKSKNRSGVRGIYYRPSKKTWRVVHTVNGKRQEFGSYKNFEDALAKSAEVISEYGLKPRSEGLSCAM